MYVPLPVGQTFYSHTLSVRWLEPIALGGSVIATFAPLRCRLHLLWPAPFRLESLSVSIISHARCQNSSSRPDGRPPASQS